MSRKIKLTRIKFMLTFKKTIKRERAMYVEENYNFSRIINY